MGSQWRDLGVRLRQEWVPFESAPAQADAEATGLGSGWFADYPDPLGMLAPFLATTSDYLGRDDEVMSLLGRAGSVRSQDERLRLCREADRLLVAERAWLVPMVYPTWFLVHRRWLEGFWLHPMGLASLGDVVVRR